MEYNPYTEKLEYLTPVNASCLNKPEGCPAMHLRSKGEQAMHTLVASTDPERDIKRVAYTHQPADKRMYMHGYEMFFNMLPVLNPGDTEIENKMAITHEVVKLLADTLAQDPLIANHEVPAGQFHRHIIGMEEPEMGSMFGDMPGENSTSEYVIKAGKEIIVAHWGDNFKSPVHGHMPGLEIEQMITGRLIVNRYELVEGTDTVHMVSSTLYTGNDTIELAYTQAKETDTFKRQQLIHNFISVGTSHSLHYVPEHSLDGNGNGFKVAYFDDAFDINEENTTRIHPEQVANLPVGSVLLVRSTTIDYFGDHFLAITGGLVVKPHGVHREHTAVIAKNQYNSLLDNHTEFDSQAPAEVVLLLLNDELTREFVAWHNIEMQPTTDVFDDHYDLRFEDVKPMTTQEAMYARRSDVMLVRSKSLPNFGDHYILVTGHAIQKEHGMRPQTAVFPAMQNSPLLDMFDGPGNNTVILKLSNKATQAFLDYYNIHLDEALNVVSETTKLEMA